MMSIKKHLPITWSVLYVGLKNNWLNTKEITAMINDNLDKLDCDEETLVDINVNDDDKATILNILKTRARGENDGIRIWQFAHLVAIEQSKFSISEKLKEIELQWSRFDYPEAWRDFIYYMPNEKINTEEGVYQNFLTFLHEERKKLNWKDNE